MRQKAIGEEVIIIGAGVVGLGIGWQLASKGHAVTILEREDQIAAANGGASGAAAGMLAPTAEVRFEEERLLAFGQHSRELYPEFVSELQSASSVDVDYRDFGTLVVGLDRDDAEALEHLLEYQHSLGLVASRLSGDAARELEPALSPNVHTAIHCPSDHQVNPRRLARAMAEAFTHEGGILRTSAPVDELLIEGGIARGCLLQSGEELTADAVLAAAGAWTRKLGGVAKKHLPRIRPVRGQMLSLEMMEGAPLCDMVIRAPDAYIVPRSDGELVIGATMEEMGFDTRLTAGGVFELLRGAWETMPGVYDLSISELWTGFRPISLSNEPILGPSPDIENLWFATGHGRNGILLTPATALHMAEAMHTGVVPEALLPFLP